ncbi:uncharacterized protein [Primulina eburnea]|uniref:uncharacterized protein isoform X2 n=1 Tax=Primulina eburnea TaxID=1245227 RepID=UPI003C6C2EB3
MVVKLIRLWRASISILQEVLLLEKPRNSLLFCFPTDVLDGHLLSRCTFFQDEGSFLQREILFCFWIFYQMVNLPKWSGLLPKPELTGGT